MSGGSERWPISVPHGVTPGRIGALLGAWLLVPVLAGVVLFEVDTGHADYARPLEQLGVMALTLPVAAATLLLGDPSAWVLNSARRSPFRVRLAWLGVVAFASAVLGVVPVLLLPDGVPRGHVAALWVLMFALGVIAVVLLGESFGGVAAAALVIAATVPGLWPYRYNIVFNLETGTEVRVVAAVMAAVAAITYARWGDATGRRGEPPPD